MYICPAVNNDSVNEGWLMISGMYLNNSMKKPSLIDVQVKTKTAGKLKVWLDGLKTDNLII